MTAKKVFGWILLAILGLLMVSWVKGKRNEDAFTPEDERVGGFIPFVWKSLTK